MNITLHKLEEPPTIKIAENMMGKAYAQAFVYIPISEYTPHTHTCAGTGDGCL